ncbi:hypothetical protein [Paenibacillus gansuensis]|uniref:Uncharacterized protein n=1 Tax=Paenibacillus gansuensis TaxID=306542 RepID=A0ABW5PH58_9BACL
MKTVIRIPNHLTQDRYWGALLMLFSKQPRLQMYFTPRYFDLEEGIVDYHALTKIAKPWSSSERFLLQLALHLFNERYKVNLSDMDYLDPTNKQLALNAIRHRFQIR